MTPLSPDQIERYADRLNLKLPLALTKSALDLLHEAHVASIPFENIDAQLGRNPPFDAANIFNKLVAQERGGWCYEMNGLLACALTTLGFTVVRVGGDVRSRGSTPQHRYDHMALIVSTISGNYLADVGFGGLMRHPLPLQPGRYKDGPFAFILERLGPTRWSYDEVMPDGRAFGFEFNEEPAEEGLLREMSRKQAVEPWSPFVKNFVVQRRSHDGHRVLRGRVLQKTDREGTKKTIIADHNSFVATLRDMGVMPNDPEFLWKRVSERHRQLFAE